jgi:hypothetical protein
MVAPMTRHVVLDGRGDPCPRCGRPTEIREHACITDRERRRPFYYRRWFYCTNRRCRTTTIVPDRYRVPGAAVERRLEQIAEQLNLGPMVNREKGKPSMVREWQSITTARESCLPVLDWPPRTEGSHAHARC